MHELHEYSTRLKRPKQIKDAFGELHGSLIEVILANLYLFVAVGHKAKSEADLSYLLRQLFKRQFGVDVTQEYGEDYRRALRRTWKVLEQAKKDTTQRQSPRRQFIPKAVAFARRYGLGA
jgi:hypothetical protein